MPRALLLCLLRAYRHEVAWFEMAIHGPRDGKGSMQVLYFMNTPTLSAEVFMSLGMILECTPAPCFSPSARVTPASQERARSVMLVQFLEPGC
jgi:hypothetical protein